MTTLAPISDELLAELRDYAELTINDLGARMAWLWRRLIDTSKDVERIEAEIVELDGQYQAKWELAYETSVIDAGKVQPSKYHEAVANRVVPEYRQTRAGLESQRRVALRWCSTMKEIHEGLRTHCANVRGMGG